MGIFKKKDEDKTFSGESREEVTARYAEGGKASGGALGGPCNHKGSSIERSRETIDGSLVVHYSCQRCGTNYDEYH